MAFNAVFFTQSKKDVCMCIVMQSSVRKKNWAVCAYIFMNFSNISRFTPGGGQTGMGYDETSNSPELSMVLEKAMVLLNSKEFSALRRILAEYEASEINIDTFAESLLQLIRDQEKVIFTVDGMIQSDIK